MADPDLELRGRGVGGGGGCLPCRLFFLLLFFTKIRGGWAPLDPPLPCTVPQLTSLLNQTYNLRKHLHTSCLSGASRSALKREERDQGEKVTFLA